MIVVIVLDEPYQVLRQTMTHEQVIKILSEDVRRFNSDADEVGFGFVFPPPSVANVTEQDPP